GWLHHHSDPSRVAASRARGKSTRLVWPRPTFPEPSAAAARHGDRRERGGLHYPARDCNLSAHPHCRADSRAADKDRYRRGCYDDRLLLSSAPCGGARHPPAPVPPPTPVCPP